MCCHRSESHENLWGSLEGMSQRSITYVRKRRKPLRVYTKVYAQYNVNVTKTKLVVSKLTYFKNASLRNCRISKLPYFKIVRFGDDQIGLDLIRLGWVRLLHRSSDAGSSQLCQDIFDLFSFGLICLLIVRSDSDFNSGSPGNIFVEAVISTLVTDLGHARGRPTIPSSSDQEPPRRLTGFDCFSLKNSIHYGQADDSPLILFL